LYIPKEETKRENIKEKAPKEVKIKREEITQRKIKRINNIREDKKNK